MKKVILSAASVAVMSYSINASAVSSGVDLTEGTSNSITTSNCSLLEAAVDINMSANVSGAYACDTDFNGIGVAACNPNGLKTDTTNFNNIYSVSSLGGSITSLQSLVCVSTALKSNAEAAAEGSNRNSNENDPV